MPKKTARAAKPSQQRSKEEQWRRRMAAQGQSGTSTGSAVVDTIEAVDVAIDDGDLSSEEMTPLASTRSTAAPRAAATTKSAARAETRAQSTATTQRRATGTGSYSQRSTSARARMAAATMSVEEEMHYIRADIRKLVVLTGLCVIVIIALAFVLPMIMA